MVQKQVSRVFTLLPGLSHPTAAGLAPLSLLRPFLFRLRDQKKLRMLLPRILEILPPQFYDHSVRVTVPSWTSLTSEMRRDFRKSLTRHLFGWDVLLSLRMRLSLADFAWVSSSCRQLGFTLILDL